MYVASTGWVDHSRKVALLPIHDNSLASIADKCFAVEGGHKPRSRAACETSRHCCMLLLLALKHLSDLLENVLCEMVVETKGVCLTCTTLSVNSLALPPNLCAFSEGWVQSKDRTCKLPVSTLQQTARSCYHSVSVQLNDMWLHHVT